MLPTLELLEIQEELLYIQELISQYAKGTTQPSGIIPKISLLQYKFSTILGKLPHSIHPHILQINSILKHLQENFITKPQSAILKINEIQTYCAHLQNISLKSQSSTTNSRPAVNNAKQRSVLEALYETKQIQEQLQHTTKELIGLEEKLPLDIQEKFHKAMEIVLKAQHELQINPMEASKDFDIAKVQVEEIQHEVQDHFAKILSELQVYSQLIIQARDNLNHI